MTKKLLSIAALTALLSTGASAFDMKATGEIVTDITDSSPKHATYSGGVEANSSLALSPNRQGNALIYPAFRSDGDWSTEISLRNTKDVAIIAKAVLYAEDDSRELLDFNIYLSPHDAAKFIIKDRTVMSHDGSIAALVKNSDGGVAVDNVKFADEVEMTPIKFNSAADAGYVIIYAMMQENAAVGVNSRVYHLKHHELFKDYRKTLDVCRELDTNTSTPAKWREIFKQNASTSNVDNGTSIATGNNAILAPNLEDNCTNSTANFTGLWKRTQNATFTSPSSNALFGEVSIANAKNQRRSILLPATALSNYVEPGKVMLWAEGEYAAIQDRRINNDHYNVTGLKADAQTFLVTQTFFTFEKTTGEDKNDATLLLTQPMKRALQMAGQGYDYWTSPSISNGNWGKFHISRTPWTDDEGTTPPPSDPTIDFVSLNSPLDGTPEDDKEVISYRSEITTLSYDTLTKGFEEVFKNGEVAGYIDIKIGQDRDDPDRTDHRVYLPAIVTEMTSTDVDGECQINWIYSATAK